MMQKLARRNRRGFTLIELMIVIAIIGILAAIAIPNFSKARRQARLKACIANMRTIEGAVEMYDMDSTGSSLIVPDVAITTITDLVGKKYIKSWPSCKSGGTYKTYGSSDAIEISCDKHGTVAFPSEET